MKLIKECTETVEYIVEATDSSGKQKNHYIKGIFLQCEMTNRNGRRYPQNIMEKEVKRYSEAYIDKNRAFGELGHPDSPSINLDRVSHMIKELKADGNNYIGKAQILDTPHGNIVKSLINAGASVGVSSRGMGSLIQKEGINIVQSDFMLATAADIVADPSAPDAFVQGIMENAEWVFNASTNSWRMAEQAKSQINKMTTRQVANAQARMFETFLNRLK